MLSFLGWLSSPFGVLIGGAVSGALLYLASRSGLRFGAVAGPVLMAVALTQYLLTAWYPVVELIATPIERQVRDRANLNPRDGYAAIVVLSGGQAGSLQPSETPKEQLGVNDRIRLAARLFQAQLAPRIVLTGARVAGELPGPQADAESMRSYLLALGIPKHAITLEPSAQTTSENAAYASLLLRCDERIAVVTSAFHMPRALREFTALGLAAYPFPSGFVTGDPTLRGVGYWLPNIRASRASTMYIREYLGQLASAVLGASAVRSDSAIVGRVCPALALAAPNRAPNRAPKRVPEIAPLVQS